MLEKLIGRIPTNFFSLVIVGPPFSGKREFLIKEAVDNSYKFQILYVTLEETPKYIYNRLNRLRANMENIYIIDASPWSGIERVDWIRETKARVITSSILNLFKLNNDIESIIKLMKKPIVLIIDNLSTLFIKHSAESVFNFIDYLNSRVKTNYGRVYYSLHDDIHEPTIIKRVIYMCDAHVKIQYEETEEKVIRRIRLVNFRRYIIPSSWKNFEITEDEGFKIV